MRKFLILMLLIAAALLSCACAADAETVPEPTLNLVTPAPTPVPTPEPVVTSVELVSHEDIPGFYTAVEGQKDTFAFTNESGETVYRACAARIERQGERELSRVNGFAAAVLDEEGNWTYELKPLIPVDYDKPARFSAIDLPEADWDLRSGFTRTDKPGLVSYTDASGAAIYAVCGRMGEDKLPVFYPAGDDGSMIPGALALDIRPFVPAYYPDGTPKDGELKIIVYQGSQSTAVYEGQGGQWEMIRLIACSTGRITPNGSFKTGDKYRYRSLFGGKGQYAVRITGHFLFHSVPIDPRAYTLEDGLDEMFIDQYEGLGTMISRGCIRMPVIDAKWIYDNCPRGTAVTITRAAGPDCPEIVPVIHEYPYVVGDNLGWDPTDPDPRNPYYYMTCEKNRQHKYELVLN